MSSRPGRSLGGSGPRWEHLLLRLTGAVLGTTYVAVAMFGALLTPPGDALLAGAVLGWVTTVSARVLHRLLRPQADAPLRYFLPAAAGAVLLAPFGTGVEQLGNSGAYLFLVLLGLLSVRGFVWVTGVDIPTAAPATTGWLRESTIPGSESTPRPSMQPSLRMLSLDELVAEWRSSEEQLLMAHGGDLHTTVRWRDALLEELHRRDPTGFDNWILDGERGPEHDLRTDPGRTTAPPPDEPTQ